MRPPGSPRQGTCRPELPERRGSALGGSHDHRGGITRSHPEPGSWLSPSSRVLQREAAEWQGVALAGGRFLHMRERGLRGIAPAGFSSVLGTPEGASASWGLADGACATSADRGAGGPPGGASLPGGPSFGRCAPARFCAVCAPCNQSWCFRWLSLRGGLAGGRLSFVARRFSPDSIFVGH